LQKLWILIDKMYKAFSWRKLYHLHLPPVFYHHRMRNDEPPEMFHLLRRVVYFFEIIVRNGNKCCWLDRLYKILRKCTAVKRFLRMDDMPFKRNLCIDIFLSFPVILPHH